MNIVQKPHVLLVITKADLGGAQIHTLGLLSDLRDQYQFTLAVGEVDFLSREAENIDIEVRLLKNLVRPINPKRDMAGYKELKSLINEIKPDLVHLHSSKAGVLGRLAAWKTKVPCLFTAHGWAFTQGAGFKQRSYGLVVEWMLGKLPSAIVTVSDYDFQLAKRFGVGRVDRLWLVKNGIGEFRRNTRLDKSSTAALQVLNIGRMSRAKNQHMLLDAVAKMQVNTPVCIVGNGHLQDALHTHADNLEISKTVEFVGAIEDVLPRFEAADVFALSSDYEGLPLSILEAMSAGLPVVATDVGGVNEAVVHGETGFLVARGDSDAFASRLDELLSNEKLRKKFGDAARKRYEDFFRLERMTSEIAALYKKTISLK